MSVESEVDKPMDPEEMTRLEEDDLMVRQEYDFGNIDKLMDKIEETKRKIKQKEIEEQKQKNMKQFNASLDTIKIGNFTFFKKDSDIPKSSIIPKNINK